MRARKARAWSARIGLHAAWGLALAFGASIALAQGDGAEAPPSKPSTTADAPAAETPSTEEETPSTEEETPSTEEETPSSEPSPDDEASSDDLVLFGNVVERDSIARLFLSSSESFSGGRVETPVIVMRGKEDGPTLCIVAGVHGDEVNGVEVVRRTVATISLESLRGTLITVPIANISAFRRGSRYLPDRRDLNRYFPGRLFGSSASRIAHRLFHEVLGNCEALVDLHTGSFHRSNLSQVRADLSDPATYALANDFGADVVVNNAGRIGTLRRAATDVGIPAITVEAGEPTRFDERQVVEALAGILRLLHARGMIDDAPFVRESVASPLAYLGTRWVRGDQGGILVSRILLGDQIEIGQVLGTISDPLSEEVEAIVAPISGRVIGMALDQVVMPGFAIYHIGIDPLPMGADVVVPIANPDPREASDPDGLDLQERPE